MTIEDSARKPARSKRRALRVGEVVEFLEYLAPPALAAPAAPYGLQVGTAQATVGNVVVTPLPTQSAILRAAADKAGLLVCAAPLLLQPLTTLRWDDPIGAKLANLTQEQISLYALSNAYAAAPGGFDDSLAERMGLAPSGALVPTHAEAQLKLVVFVPPDAVARVRDAAGDAGAGVIGNYAYCAFETRGVGMFLAGADAVPTLGRVGRRETMEESRLEMVVPERELPGVLTAVLHAHPYEEVAYDVYPLRNPGVMYGRGRIGELPLHVSLDTILAQASDALTPAPAYPIRCSHRPETPIGTLAVASGTGAGESLLWAAHRQQAGALLTGGMSTTDAMLADSTTTVVIDVGFAPSVAPGLQRLAAQLRDTFAGDGLRVIYVP